MKLLISATSDAPRRDAETPHAESEYADPRSEAESDTEGESASPVATEGRPTSDLDAEKATAETDAVTYRDVDRLRAVYEEYDTFAEMTEALDVDVTSQTVRRHMIEYGIHEPASGTGSDAAGALLDADAELPCETADGPPVSESTSDGSSEVRGPGDGEMMADGEGAVTESDATVESELTVDDSGESGRNSRPADAVPDDGTDLDVDLPDHLTLEDIKVTVQEAQTLYEAQQRLDLDRDETRRLLQRLNLLDLVHGRAATRDIVSRTVEDINQRLQSTVRPEPDRT